MSDTPATPDAAACGVCAAPTGDSARLCRTHTDDLHAYLAGGKVKGVDYLPMVELVAELDITATRQARTAPKSDGRATPERPLMWNEHAAGKAFELGATVNAWALDVSRRGEDTRDPLAPIPHDDTAAVAAWLVRNLNGLRQHPEAGQAYDELTNAVLEAHHAIDRVQDPVPFGKCLQVFEEGTICQDVLYGQLDRATVRCRACGTVHQVEARLAWMLDQVRGRLATLHELVSITRWAGKPATYDRLRLLAHRERIKSTGQIDGEPAYRVTEVLTALDDRYKRRPASGAA